MRKSPTEEINLTDRFAVGMLSAFAALLTGTFIWFIVLYSLPRINIDYELSFTYVVVFSGVMFGLGFATMTNLVSNMLGAIWHFLYRSLRVWE